MEVTPPEILDLCCYHAPSVAEELGISPRWFDATPHTIRHTMLDGWRERTVSVGRFGPLEVPAEKYWGAQTQRSIQNFRIGWERQPIPIVRALGVIKKACAEVNIAQGDIDPAIGRAIAAAAGLEFSGIQAYQGAMQHLDSFDERKAKIDIAVGMVLPFVVVTSLMVIVSAATLSAGFTGTGDRKNVAAGLSALADNGGFTRTHAIAGSSAALMISK